MLSERIDAVEKTLDGFASARAGGKRFWAQEIGADVDPHCCLADWLSLIRKNDRAAIEKTYGDPVSKSVMGETSGTSAGYTVPPQFSTALMRDLSRRSLWRRNGAWTVPMTSYQCMLPLPDVSTPRAAGTAPYFGGIELGWLNDSPSPLPNTNLTFRNLTLTAWPLGGTLLASNPFLHDAVGVEDWLLRLLAGSAAWYQDLAFFQGLGVGTPQGVIAAGGSLAYNRVNAGTVDQADAEGMLASLLPSSWDEGAVWFCHPSVLAILPKFTGWIANGPLQLYGLPIFATAKCAPLGSPGDLILATPPLYVIGDRLQVEVAYSAEQPQAWLNNSSAFRILSRVDGQPALAAPVTLSDGQTQTSPFVVLH